MRISQEEWNKRLEEVKLASEECSSIEELTEITDYNTNGINYMLKKFPKDAEQIKENLNRNKERKRKTESNIRKPGETTLKKVTALTAGIVEENLAKKEEKIKEEKEPNSKNNTFFVMLDTSISDTEDIFHILETYAKEGKKLALTDVVLEELANLQKSNTKQAAAAREFLYIIMDNLSSFELFKVKHEMKENETVDEAVIEFCIKLKNKVLLLTSDKEMFIKAMLQKVNTRYLSKNPEEREKKIFDLRKRKNKKNIVEFIDILIQDGKAIYVDKNRNNQYIRVFSRNKEEKQGRAIALEKGDHIFMCTAKEEYMTFADYEIYDTTVNTVNMKYNYRIYGCDSVISLVQPEYKKFAEHARRTLIKE